MRKVSQTRLKTKLWRLELTLAILAHLLKHGESTVAELKCFVHIPPDVVRRKERMRSPAAGAGRITAETAKSDQLSQILWQLWEKGYVGKIRVGKANVYDCSEQTEQAYNAYRKVLQDNQA